MLDKKDFGDIAPEVRESYRTHVFYKGKDVNDKSFPPYKEPYKSLKATGKLRGQQSGVSVAKTAPVVSTGLLKDFGSFYKVTNSGFQMGWSVYGSRVESLVKRKRLLTTKEKALPNAVAKVLDKEVDRAIKKKLGPNKTTRHRIGRK